MTDYSNREIDSMIKTLTTFVEEKFTDQNIVLGIIKDGVEKQNGRVRKLEKWQSFIMGGLAIIGIVIMPIIFLSLSKLFDTIGQQQFPTTQVGIQQRVVDLQAETEKLQIQLQVASSTKI